MYLLNYNKLWKLLIDKDIKNRSELLHLCGINSNTLAALGKNEPIHLKYIIRICEVLDCKIEDILTLEKMIKINK